MSKINKPALSYIHRNTELVSLQVRVTPEVKEQAEIAAHLVDTSLNRFVEAAVKWYIDALKKDGAL